MDTFNINTRVAAYPRVSTEEQKQNGLSIEAQTEALKKWAAERKLKIVGVYNDAGHTARKSYDKRPEMIRLLNDVKGGKIDLVIFTKLDRWFRNISEYYKVQEILEAHNVRWKAIHDDYDTATASGRLKINIMLAVAQDEADRVSERIKAVFDGKRERREPVTGWVPTGYMIQDKKIVKDPQWESAVNAFFETFLRVQSTEETRKHLRNALGINITYQLADMLLKKEAYCGKFNGVEDMCPPYITREQHELILSLRRKSVRTAKQNRIYLFSGILICGHCGGRMSSNCMRYQRTDGTKIEKLGYKCTRRYNQNNCDNSYNPTESSVEEYLLKNISTEMSRQTSAVTIGQERIINPHEQERAALKRKAVKLKELFLNDLIDLDMYRADYEKLTAQLKAIPESKPAKKLDKAKYEQIYCDGWAEIYNGLSQEGKREFWRNSLEAIEIYRDKSIAVSFLKTFD